MFANIQIPNPETIIDGGFKLAEAEYMLDDTELSWDKSEKLSKIGSISRTNTAAYKALQKYSLKIIGCSTIFSGGKYEESILECHKANPHWSYGKIARQVGCSPTTVRLLLDKKAALKADRYNKKRKKTAILSRKLRDDAKRRSDPDAWFKREIGSYISDYLRISGGRRKERPTEDYLSYTIGALMKLLEKSFDSRINWNSYGTKWRLGHKIESKYFNLSEFVQQLMFFHYSNFKVMKIEKRFNLGSALTEAEIDAEMMRLYRLIEGPRYYSSSRGRRPNQEWWEMPGLPGKPRWFNEKFQLWS